jgi:hypothetical protein
MYAYQTNEGQAAIRKRNQTAEFYACLKGLNLVVDRDPLNPVALSFQKGGKIQELAIVRNRNESMAEFTWPSVMITTAKINQLVTRAKHLRVAGQVLVNMADNVLLSWTVIDNAGNERRYGKQVTTTKGDCMGSHFASRENTFLPISEATVFEPQQLI